MRLEAVGLEANMSSLLATGTGCSLLFFPSVAFSALARSQHSVCVSDELCSILHRSLFGVSKESMDLFFRPSPSRLSPGRNTVFVSVERIVQHLASFPLWGIKKRAWTYTQSKLSLCDGDTRSKTRQNKQKPQKAQTKQKQNKAPNRKQKNHIIGAGHRLQPPGSLTS